MADRKLTRMTPKEIKAQLARRTPRAVAEARKRYDETTEEDIRRHMREDGYDPERESPADARRTVPVKLVREKLRMTQAELAALLHVPLGTLRNWEQNRFSIDPAVQALLLVLYREPEAALARSAPCCLIPGVTESAVTFFRRRAQRGGGIGGVAGPDAAGAAIAAAHRIRGLGLRRRCRWPIGCIRTRRGQASWSVERCAASTVHADQRQGAGGETRLTTLLSLLIIRTGEQTSNGRGRKQRVGRIHLREKALLYGGLAVRVSDLIECLRKFNDSLVSLSFHLLLFDLRPGSHSFEEPASRR